MYSRCSCIWEDWETRRCTHSHQIVRHVPKGADNVKVQIELGVPHVCDVGMVLVLRWDRTVTHRINRRGSTAIDEGLIQGKQCICEFFNAKTKSMASEYRDSSAAVTPIDFRNVGCADAPCLHLLKIRRCCVAPSHCRLLAIVRRERDPSSESKTRLSCRCRCSFS